MRMDELAFAKFTCDLFFFPQLALDLGIFFHLCTDLVWSVVIGVGVGTAFMVPFSFRAMKCLMVLKAIMMLSLLVALCIEAPEFMRFFCLEWGIISSLSRIVPEKNELVVAVVLLSAFVSQCLGLFEPLASMASQAEFTIQTFILAALLVYAVYILWEWHKWGEETERLDEGNFVIEVINIDGSIDTFVYNAYGSIVRTTRREPREE